MSYNVTHVGVQEESYVIPVLDGSMWNTQNAYVSKYTETTIIRGLYRAEQAGRLRAARKAAGMSQADLAKALGMAPTTYASCEQGDNGVGFDLADRLAKHFDVAVEWWLGTMTAKEAALIGIERGHRGQIVEPPKTSHEVGGQRQGGAGKKHHKAS